MTEIGFIEWTEKIHRYWEKQWFLFLTLIVIITTYFSLGKLIFEDDFNYKNPFVFLTLLVLIIITIVIWFFSTNRLFFKIRKKDFTGILILSEDEKEAVFIKKIVKNVIREIQDESKFPQWKIFILPINYCVGKKKIEAFLSNRQSQLDNLFVLKCESGKFESLDKIIVSEIGFCLSTSLIKNTQIFSEEIDPVKDLKLRGINKDWIALEENLGNDKKKILSNIKDIIVFYFGIWKVLNAEFDTALSALQVVYNHADTCLSEEQTKEGKLTLSKNNLVAGRHRTILIELIIRLSIELASEKRYQEIFGLLKIGEPLVANDRRGFVFYMNMARAAYECGKIEEAKRCTNLMDKIKPNCVQVLINKAFLNLVDGNTRLFLLLYKNIFVSRDKYLDSPLSLLEFLNGQRERHLSFKMYIDFAIGTINKLYADAQLGQSLLEEVINANDTDNLYADVKALAKTVYLLDPQNDLKITSRKLRNKKKKRRA